MKLTNKPVRKPIAVWWKLDRISPKIEPLQVVAFTGSFVTYLKDAWGLRANTLTEHRESRDDIFPTFAEAKAEAVRRAARNIDQTKEKLQRYRSWLGNIESLREPKPTELPAFESENSQCVS